MIQNIVLLNQIQTTELYVYKSRCTPFLPIMCVQCTSHWQWQCLFQHTTFVNTL